MTGLRSPHCQSCQPSRVFDQAKRKNDAAECHARYFKPLLKMGMSKHGQRDDRDTHEITESYVAVAGSDAAAGDQNSHILRTLRDECGKQCSTGYPANVGDVDWADQAALSQ